MQVIIAPVSGENWIIPDVAVDTPVVTFRGLIASKLKTEPHVTKLICEGHELVDGATLHDFYVSNLSTVRVTIVGSTPPVAAAAHPGDETASLVSDEEMPRSIILRNLPSADPATTEKAIFDSFSRFGEISRLVFQDEAHAATGGAPPSQQAVVVFYRDAPAAASLAADGMTLLGGGPVRVVLASSLGARRSSAATAMAPVKLLVPSAAVIGLLAKGFLYGNEGVAHVKRYDERTGLTRRVKVWADSTDARFHISATMLSAYTAAAAQAQQLEGAWQNFDRTHRIHERINAGVMAAIDHAQAIGSSAMRDPTINRAVTATQDLVREIGNVVHDTVQQAHDKARVAFLQQEAQRVLEATSTAAVESAPSTLPIASSVSDKETVAVSAATSTTTVSDSGAAIPAVVAVAPLPM